MSESKIEAAIVEAQRQSKTLTKESKNSFHRYAYVNCEKMIEAGRECLTAAGLALVTRKQSLESFGDDGLMLHSEYCLVHEAGEHIDFGSITPVVVEKGKPLDKAVSAAKSLDLAYFIRNLLLFDKEDASAAVDARDDRQYKRRAGQ